MEAKERGKMFLPRLAAGLVFAVGVVSLKLAVVGESALLLVAGLATAAVGVCWFTLGGAPFAVADVPPSTR